MLTLTDLKLNEYKDYDNHERIVFVKDDTTNLHGVIAVHNTRLGPAMGGCRIVSYSSKDAAVTDALRLSRGMTFKSALAGLPLGGGKSVIMLEKGHSKTEGMLKSFGEAIERLEGLYITAEDVGSTEEDMITLSHQTHYVSGLPPSEETPLSGNPSPVTARGIFYAVQACFEGESLKGKSFSVKGLGAVGYALAQYLDAAGASLYVSDINDVRVKEACQNFANASPIDVDQAHKQACDLYAPCALGADLNDQTIPEIAARYICGAANNQLDDPQRHDRMLFDKGRVYVPDYAANSAGIIAVCYAYFDRTGLDMGRPLTLEARDSHVARISDTVSEILKISHLEKRPTGDVADSLAHAKIVRG